jgi:hypothetical protein
LGGSVGTIFVALGLFLDWRSETRDKPEANGIIGASVIASASGTVQEPSAWSGRE